MIYGIKQKHFLTLAMAVPGFELMKVKDWGYSKFK
jgi:hypothetical protein